MMTRHHAKPLTEANTEVEDKLSRVLVTRETQMAFILLNISRYDAVAVCDVLQDLIFGANGRST